MHPGCVACNLSARTWRSRCARRTVTFASRARRTCRRAWRAARTTSSRPRSNKRGCATRGTANRRTGCSSARSRSPSWRADGGMPLSVDQLIEAACTRTGQSDFAADGWREGHGVVGTSLELAAALSPLGRDVLTDQLVGHLANRLEIEHWHRGHPAVAEQVIAAPL